MAGDDAVLAEVVGWVDVAGELVEFYGSDNVEILKPGRK
jgi:hypothetical protein